VLEEMVYRGYFLMWLRPYGDVLAIAVSAVLFAVMHGNLLQLPFTLILGIAFGYIVIRTGRLWIAIVIHFINNALSNVLQHFSLYQTQAESSRTILIVFSVLGILGLLAVLGLVVRKEPIVQLPARSHRRAPWGELLRSAPFVLAVAASLLLVVWTTSWGGGAT